MRHPSNPYIALAKPGIVYGNLFAGIAGYFLGAEHISGAIIMLILGLGFVLASAGYANNIMDLSIDAKMERTQKRPLVSGQVPLKHAYIGAAALLLIGLMLLYIGSNILTALLALMGWAGYLFLYGYAKRRTYHSTFIGALPGALPPLIGYVFATHYIDAVGFILFMMMVFWQMPHFYGISIFRKSEYQAAQVPLLSIKKGVARTLLEMRLYVVLYTIACLAMIGVGKINVGATFLLLGSALWWGLSIVSRDKSKSDEAWARTIFKKSLLVLVLWPIVFAVNYFF